MKGIFISYLSKIIVINQNKFPFHVREKKNGEKPTNFCAICPIVLIMSMLCMISLEIGQFDQIAFEYLRLVCHVYSKFLIQIFFYQLFFIKTDISPKSKPLDSQWLSEKFLSQYQIWYI